MPTFESLTHEEQQQRVAMYLNCDPHRPGSWPMDLIERLIILWLEKGQGEFDKELRRLMTPCG